jgi:lipopolysaccharide export system permease protein
MPRTKAQTNYIWNQLVEKRPGRFYHKENFWYKGQNSIYRIGQFDPAGQELLNLMWSISALTSNFNMVLRIDAKKAVLFRAGQMGVSKKACIRRR